MSIIKEYIEEYLNDNSEQNIRNLLAQLVVADIWVPCSTVLSEADQKRFEKMVDEAQENGQDLEGTIFKTQDDMHLVPDLLENEKGDLVFPVFSSEEEMGEYGENFSNVEMTFMEAMRMAENNPQNPIGIVINAFSRSFFISKEIFGSIDEIAEARQAEISSLDVAIPFNFVKADSMEGDPEGSIPFSVRTEQTDALLFYIESDLEGAIPLGATEMITDVLNQQFAGTDESLVEVKEDKTAEGLPYIYYISKTEEESSGDKYRLRCEIRLSDKCVNLDTYFEERFQSSEKDETSPGHPLQMARDLVEFICQNN